MMGLLVFVSVYGLNLLWMHVLVEVNIINPEDWFEWFLFYFFAFAFTMFSIGVGAWGIQNPNVPLVVVLAVVIIYFINKLTSKLSGVIVAALNKRKLNNETDGEIE